MTTTLPYLLAITRQLPLPISPTSQRRANGDQRLCRLVSWIQVTVLMKSKLHSAETNNFPASVAIANTVSGLAWLACAAGDQDKLGMMRRFFEVRVVLSGIEANQ